MQIKRFSFNMMDENTYVAYDATGDCVIIDCGCNDPREQQELTDFISVTHPFIVNVLCYKFF